MRLRAAASKLGRHNEGCSNCIRLQKKLIPPPLLTSAGAGGGDYAYGSTPPPPAQLREEQRGGSCKLKNEAMPSLLFNVSLLFLTMVLNLHEVRMMDKHIGMRENAPDGLTGYRINQIL